MDSTIEVKDSSTISIFNSCKNAYHLIKEGREHEAKELFPLEYYLVTKYLYRSLSDLSSLLQKRLELA